MTVEQAAFIFRLPNELLQYIIHLSSAIHYSRHEVSLRLWPYPEHSPADLKSIALTCRQLYLVCATFLWKDKEFVLPKRDHIVHNMETTATTILSSTNTLSKAQQGTAYDEVVSVKRAATETPQIKLGDYVRSLYRDLTNGPHFDLPNTEWLAQLVPNLRALRIDFHPSPRNSASYGLNYFVCHCPLLQEICLSWCQDTHGDFETVCNTQSGLESITLLDCTIQQRNLVRLINKHSSSIKRLVLQNVLIEPVKNSSSATSPSYDSPGIHYHRPLDFDMDNIHPFHLKSVYITRIPQSLLRNLLNLPNLSELALMTDAIDLAALKALLMYSPLLTKLFILINENDPLALKEMLELICGFAQLKALNLKFSYSGSDEGLLPEYSIGHVLVPAFVWQQFAESLTRSLMLLSITADSLVVTTSFFDELQQNRPHLHDIQIWYAVVTVIPHQPLGTLDGSATTEILRDICIDECLYISNNQGVLSNDSARYVLSPQEAIDKGYDQLQFVNPPKGGLVFIKGLTPDMLQ